MSSDFRVGMQSAFKDYYAELSSLRQLPATFLACPKKGGAKEGHPATILIRLARLSSVHFRNSGFALRQSEMFNPRTRSHDGNVRMGRRSTALEAFTQIRGYAKKLHGPNITHTKPGRARINYEAVKDAQESHE